MTSLVEKFERFRREHLAPNPGRESELGAFTQQLSADGELGEYTDEDWLALSRKLGLNDDQYAALMEGTASWIVDEYVPITEQESADWPDETPPGARNSAPVTRGNPSKSARRGTEEFDDLMDELEDEWELDEEEIGNIVELRRAGDSFEIRMKGEDRWELLEDDGPEGSDDEDSDGEEPEDSDDEGEEE